MRPTRRLEYLDTAMVPAVMPRTDKIKISPMRWAAMQRDAAASKDRPLTKSVYHALFMEIMDYFHEHIDQPMPSEVCNAISRVYDASQGFFVDPAVLFLDLHIIQDCDAGRGHPKLIEAAMQSLFAR